MNASVAQLGFVFDIADNVWTERAEDIIKYTVRMLNNHSDGWHDDDIFPDGTVIEWQLRNASCDATSSPKAYWDIRHQLNETPPMGLIGARCSSSSMSLAMVSALENVPQVSHASTSPQLSFKEGYPLFSRLVAPDDSRGQAGALVSMLTSFGWKRVSVLKTDNQYSRDLAMSFKTLWVDAGGKVAYENEVQVNDDDELVVETSVDQVLSDFPTRDPMMITRGSRVILLIAHDQHAYEILRLAHKKSFQSDTIWIGTAAWVGRGRSPNDFAEPHFMQGYLGVTPFQNRNPTYQDYLQRLNIALSEAGEPTFEELPDYAAETLVDSILALTMALSKLPGDSRRNGSLVTERLRNLSFHGVSGEVAFTTEGDRANPSFSILNAQVNSGTGKLDWVNVGTVWPSGNVSDEIRRSEICFADLECGLTSVPDDSYFALPVHLWVLIVIPLIIVLLGAVLYRYGRSKQKKNRYKQSMLAFQEKISGIDDKIEEAKKERERLINGRFEKPPTWTDEEKTLVNVSPFEEEYWTVMNQLKSEMPDAYISRLWRVQNQSLWAFYTFHKDRFSMNGIDHSETKVWHGTSELDPGIIYNDRHDGFMMQFARMGFWGRGIYFAKKSSYSHSYAYKPHGEPWQAAFMDRPVGLDGEREMFLSKLLVGKAKRLPQDKTLIVPPDDPDRPGQRFNTVEGFTGGSEVYIVYENGRAYPEFMVRYYTGQRDPSRTQFETQDEAKKCSTMKDESTTADRTTPTDDLESGLAEDCSMGTWEFQDNNGGWTKYGDSHQAILEKALQRGESKVQLQTDDWTYEVDLIANVQVNLLHPLRKERQVRRHVCTHVDV